MCRHAKEGYIENRFNLHKAPDQLGTDNEFVLMNTLFFTQTAV
jgi:hypothetical protein